MGVILDSSILVATERKRFDLERLLLDHSPHAIAVITAAELLIGVERADTPQRRTRREEFVKNFFAHTPIITFDFAHAELYAIRFAELAGRGETIGDRDLQIAVTALKLNYDVATLNAREFTRVSGLRLVDITSYVIS